MVLTLLDRKNNQSRNTLKKMATYKHELVLALKTIEEALDSCPTLPLEDKLLFVKKTAIPLLKEYFITLKTLHIEHVLTKYTFDLAAQLNLEMQELLAFSAQEKSLYAQSLMDDTLLTVNIFTTPPPLTDYPYAAMVNEHFPFLAVTRAYFKAVDVVTETIKHKINLADKIMPFTPGIEWKVSHKLLYEIVHYCYHKSLINTQDISFNEVLQYIDLLFHTSLATKRMRHTTYKNLYHLLERNR